MKYLHADTPYSILLKLITVVYVDAATRRRCDRLKLLSVMETTRLNYIF